MCILCVIQYKTGIPSVFVVLYRYVLCMYVYALLCTVFQYCITHHTVHTSTYYTPTYAYAPLYNKPTCFIRFKTGPFIINFIFIELTPE